MRLVVFVFRWVMPAFGLAFLLAGLLGAPGRGEPPLASLFGRAETMVRDAGVEPAGFAGGRPRHRARIEVAWPPGEPTVAVLGGVHGGMRPDAGTVAEVVAAHPPGTRLTVRVAQGRPWADRTDWFALAWTLGAVLIGGLLAAVGLLLNRVLRP